MTMNRAIHHAVRRDLDRLEGALRVLEDGDRERVAELSRAWQNLHDQLVEHHEKEDELVWPALQGLGIDPVLLEEMESEHAAMRDALEELDGHMRQLGTSAGAPDALAAADSVVTTREVVERHLSHEEVELEPQMLLHKDTPEWKAVEKQLRSGSPVRGGRMFAWLLDGASPEVAGYVRSVVPGPVLVLLTRVFGIGYQRSIAPVWRT
jgi:hemerythrin-like domain-containing protein